MSAKANESGSAKMGYIGGESRNQRYLLPEAIDEYIGADNPVRFVDAFVEKLDLEELGFERAVAAETRRPGYDPGDLLRLYLYGDLNRTRSSRRLEREASEPGADGVAEEAAAGLQEHCRFQEDNGPHGEVCFLDSGSPYKCYTVASTTADGPSASWLSAGAHDCSAAT